MLGFRYNTKKPLNPNLQNLNFVGNGRMDSFSSPYLEVWVVISVVKTRVSIVITHIRGLITPVCNYP